MLQILSPYDGALEALAYAPDVKKLLIVLRRETTSHQFASLEAKTDEIQSVDPNGEFVRGAM